MAAIMTEPLRFVVGADEAMRLAMGTGRVEMLGGMERHIPDVTRRVLADIKFGQLPAATGYEDKLAGFFQPGSTAWNDFFATRKVVERDVGGRRLVSVTSNIHDALSAEYHVGQPVSQVGPDQELRGRDRPRTYQLAQLMTDTHLMDKFGFPERFLTTIRNMAIALPEQAAAKVQSYIRGIPGNERASVRAGAYARSKKWARASVAHIAEAFPILSVACDSVVVDNKLMVYGPSGPGSWFVMGPLWYASEIMQVYRMVCTAGTSATMFAMGTELVVLDIDIHNGESFESPSVDYHVGAHDSLPMTSSPVTGSLLSAMGQAKMQSLQVGVEALEVDGDNAASAVRITHKYVLVNTHVLDKGSVLRIRGVPAVPYRMLSKDLWLVSCECEQSESVWSLRDPEVGESVVVLYRKNDTVQYTAPLTLRSTDGITMVMSRDSELQSGMSGGAILSLTDFSLLGVYNGVGSQSALGSVFSQEHFTEVHTSDHASAAALEDARDLEGAIYSHLRGRGLGRVVDSAISAMVPMYDGDTHVGMGVMRGQELLTACDVETRELAVGFGGTHVTYEQKGGLYVASVPALGRSGPMLYRKPKFGESVLVVGIDREGPYHTGSGAQVVHVGLSADTFTIGPIDDDVSLPYVGGVVLSVTDAAVLGVYQGSVSSHGTRADGLCLNLRPPDVSVSTKPESLAVGLLRKFPMLHPTVWADGLLEEVFTFSNVQAGARRLSGASAHYASPLSLIGRSAATTSLYLELRRASVPVGTWVNRSFAVHSASALFEVVERYGLAAMARMPSGAVFIEDKQLCSQLLQSLVGAVYLSETAEVFEQFCRACGLLSIDAQE